VPVAAPGVFEGLKKIDRESIGFMRHTSHAVPASQACVPHRF
jgi:hypothetical protein